MEAPPQCPVCTLYLHPGMALEAHLDTHPKEQVIRALCRFARPASRSSQSSQSSSPLLVSTPASSVQSTPPQLSASAFFVTPTLGPNGNGSVPSLMDPKGSRTSVVLKKIAPDVRNTSFSYVDPKPVTAFQNVMVLKPFSEPVSFGQRTITADASALTCPRPIRPSNPYITDSNGITGPGPVLINRMGFGNDRIDPPLIEISPKLAPIRPASRQSQNQNRLTGVKIISDVKIENPTQTGSGLDLNERSELDPILPDFDDVNFYLYLNENHSAGPPANSTASDSQPTPNDSFESDYRPDPTTANAFSVIKNVGNPAQKNTNACTETIISDSVSTDDSAYNTSSDSVVDTPKPEAARPAPKIDKSKSGLLLLLKSNPADDFLLKRPKRPGAKILKIKPKSNRTQRDQPILDTSTGSFKSESDGSVDKVDGMEIDDPELPKDDSASNEHFPNFSQGFADQVGECSTSSKPYEETARPGNVITFGSADEQSRSTDLKIADTPTFNASLDAVQKTEITIRDKSTDPWPPQKEEFTFTNFIRCSYNQSIYQKLDTAEDKVVLDNKKKFIRHMSPNGFVESDRKNSFLNALENSEMSESEGLNIRTDERMPPRGELSEQESNGDMDAPWAPMYHDAGGSTSYDMARESWPSDASDVDAPVSPLKRFENETEIEDIPIVVSVKPPDRNYKCATCGKGFNCPKERRVHRSKEHPSISAPTVFVKNEKKQMLIKTNIKIKNEKIIKTECVISSTRVNSLHIEDNLDDSDKIDIKPVKADIAGLELTESRPDFALVKYEGKKKRNYCCATCKEEFPTEAQFHEHSKVHPLECLTCGKLFTKLANLNLHIKRHLGIKNFRCDVCDKRFITKQKLAEHYNIHTGDSPIKCNLCDLTFRRHSNMTQHRNHHHYLIKKKLRDFVCTCGEVFHSKKKLAWHKEIHDDKPKACLYCNEKFIHSASLTRHMRRTHNSFFASDGKKETENVQCPKCNLVYLKSSLETHMKTHTGVRPYSCVICNKSFTTKWNLKLHKWTHANRSSKPYKCNLCKSAFMRNTDYVSHMNAHKSVRPYTCNHCGCQFIRKYNCQRHVREHENEKKFVCDVPDCGKSFHRSYYLSEHLRVHSGDRPFSCNICGKQSSTKSNHNKHVKIHHAREPVMTEG